MSACSRCLGRRWEWLCRLQALHRQELPARAGVQTDTAQGNQRGLSICPLRFQVERLWLFFLSSGRGAQPTVLQGTQGAGQGRAGSVGAGDTDAQTCPSADSLAVGRLLNPKALQFPHPKKCRHLSPGALFSFQGFGGVGQRRGGRSGLALLGLLLSAGAPCGSHQPLCAVSQGACPRTCDGSSPGRAGHQQLLAGGKGCQPQKGPSRRARSGSGWIFCSL